MKYVIRNFIIFVSLLIFSILTVNFIVDPFQNFRRNPSRYYFPFFLRYHVSGVVQTHPFNSCIIGTSMAQKFNIKKLNQLNEGVDCVNLALPGSEMLLQSYVLKKTIARKNLKLVFWGIDLGYLRYKANFFPSTFPKYMYEDNIFPKLLSIDVLKYSLYQLLPFFSYTKDINLIGQEHHNRNAALFKNIPLPQKRNAKKTPQNTSLKESHFTTTNPDNYWDRSKQIEFNLKALSVSNNQKIQNFENAVFSVIKDNPAIKFYVFFPPRSIICLRKMSEDDIELRYYIMERLTSLPNVEFYDFESNEAIVTRLQNYYNPSHYYEHINDWMVECFVSKKDRVMPKDIDAFQKRFERLWAEDVKITP